MPSLLQGIRVLDFTSVVSGPVCTNTLATLGAEVVKIEPPKGDPLRWAGPDRPDGRSAHFMQVNSGKKSVVLNLQAPDDLQACLKLAATADVVVENFRPGVMDRLGLGYDAIRSIKEDVIYASISGFGPDGPWSRMRAYDSMIQALSGFMTIQGGKGDPELIQCAVADKIAGRTAAEAILAALFGRERGMGGQKISISMLDAYITFMMQDMMNDGLTFMDDTREVKRLGIHAKFATRDGWISFLFVRLDEYHELFRTFGLAGLCDDPRFISWAAFRENFGEYMDEISKALAVVPTSEVIDACRRAKLPIAQVLSTDEMLSFEQVRHNQTFSEHRLAGSGERIRIATPPWRFEKDVLPEFREAPLLGEHNAKLLSEATD